MNDFVKEAKTPPYLVDGAGSHSWQILIEAKDALDSKFGGAIRSYCCPSPPGAPFPEAFLTVEAPGMVDPRLKDQPSTRLKCKVDVTTGSIICALEAWNRCSILNECYTVYDHFALEGLVRSLLLESRFTGCPGFTEGDGSGVLDHASGGLLFRLRKDDIPLILLEKYGDQLVLRSRNCSFAFGPNEKLMDPEEHLFSDRCSGCNWLFLHMDRRYSAGRLSREIRKAASGGPQGAENSRALDQFEEDDHEVKPPPPVMVEDLTKSVARPRRTIKRRPVDEAFSEEEAEIYSDEPAEKIRRKISDAKRRGRPPKGPKQSIECNQCSEVFKKVKDWKKHRNVEHESKFACTVEGCEKRFKSEEDLVAHDRKHRGEKPYRCAECGKLFENRQNFKVHKKGHLGEKPFKCSVCLKAFAKAQQRDVHLAVHTGVRAHLCPVCGKAFGSASSMIDHRKRTHLNIREHPCTLCSKQFFNRQELEQHTRTHTGHKPFKCKECGKLFARVYHLKRHHSHVHEKKAPKSTRSKKPPPADIVGHEGSFEEDVSNFQIVVAEDSNDSGKVFVEDDASGRAGGVTAFLVDETAFILDDDNLSGDDDGNHTVVVTTGSGVVSRSFSLADGNDEDAPGIPHPAALLLEQSLGADELGDEPPPSIIRLRRPLVSGLSPSWRSPKPSPPSKIQNARRVVAPPRILRRQNLGDGTFVIVTASTAEAEQDHHYQSDSES